MTNRSTTGHRSGVVVGATDQATAIELIGVCKSFPGVVALNRLDFSVRRGEVHALIGENGAGKSTAIKLMTGVYSPDEGRIRVDDETVRLRDPHEARGRGINYVPQDVLIVPALSVGRNILLGQEGGLSRRTRLAASERAKVCTAMERCGAHLDEDAIAARLSVPQLRLIQLARGVVDDHASVLILDEPTAVLSESDADHFLSRIAMLRDEGAAVIFVSHRLSEVVAIADRISVLRDGELVGTFGRRDVTAEQLIALMSKDPKAGSGMVVRADDPQPAVIGDEPLLQVRDVGCGTDVLKVNLEASAGQVIGIAGVQGSGHGALLHALAGARSTTTGSVLIDGQRLSPGNVRDGFAKGLVLVSADRRNAAVLPSMTVHTNLALSGRIRRSCRRAGLRWIRQERQMAMSHVERFSIRPAAIDSGARHLSGGNQQKLAIARALECDPKVLLIEEPTQSVDIHAKAEIREILLDAASRGLCVVIASSEFEELIGLADEIHVMRLGRVVANMSGTDATYREILAAALS
jgi:ABC-type sugar transport system ATPase subunit